MDLKQLEAAGGIYTAPPVRKTLTWERIGEDGEELSDTFDIFVRRIPYGTMERIITSAGDDNYSMTVQMIAAGVRLGEDGKEAIDEDTAYLLDPSLARLFADAVEEVNTRRKKRKAALTGSGISSFSTESAGAALPKPSSD